MGSLDEVKVQVRQKFCGVCGAMQGMESARPSSCVIRSEREHTSTYLLYVCPFMKKKSLCNQNPPWLFQEAVHTWVLSADMKEQK